MVNCVWDGRSAHMFGTCWEQCERCETLRVISVFESPCRSVVLERFCMWQIFLWILFFVFCLHLFTANPTPLEITPRRKKKKKKDSSASVNIASILNVNPWTVHLNSAQQLLTWRSSFYRTYCAKPCQHFMQDKPVSSWSRYSKHVSGSGFILIFSSLSKGTIDVN